jgi:hypothetical protein
MGRPRRDRRTKAPVHRSTTTTPNRGVPDFMRKDFLGMKQQIVKGVPNNYIYLGGAALTLIGTALVASDMGLVDLSLFGVNQEVSATASAMPQLVRTGEPVRIVGDVYDKSGKPIKLPQIYLAIYEDNGDVMMNQQVAQDSAHFEVSVPTQTYRDGTYSFVIDKSPIVGKPAQLTNVPQYNQYDISVSPGGGAFPLTPSGGSMPITIT